MDRMVVHGSEGRGVQVQASGSLVLRNSLVEGNRDLGLSLFGSKAVVERSVLRNTREVALKKTFGNGIQAAPALSGQPRGSELTLRDSLVTGNRYKGVALFGSKATLERSVVRDTREQASDQQSGTGILASFDSSGQGQRSEVILRDSLVEGNRDLGLSLWSSRATVERSVIRDTRENAADKNFGRGIQAAVEAGQSQGSELTLRDSLVTGNRTDGIVLFSSKASVLRSVVGDNLEQASDKQFGVGIRAVAGAAKGKGSEVTVRNSLVAGNRSAGIALESSSATVSSSVVRDTIEQAKYKTLGVGIHATQGSVLTLSDSLVAGNRSAGVFLFSSSASVLRSVVRGNLEQVSDKKLGAGIQASVAPNHTLGSTLTVSDSLVTGNRTNGIDIQSSTATVERSVVRDTLEQTSGKKGGQGINAEVQSGQTRGSVLTLRDSLVTDNRSAGIKLLGSKAIVQRCVVRDTGARASDNKGGEGLWATFDPQGKGRGSELTIRDSIVTSNRSAGVALLGSKATVERCVVRDTRKNASQGKGGVGIEASVGPGQTQGSELTLRDSLVAGNRAGGVSLFSSRATLERSVVRDTQGGSLNDEVGQGIHAQIESGQTHGSELVVRDSLVANNCASGISLLSSRATVERSVVRDTREWASNKKHGRGIQASAQAGHGQGSELTLRDSVVAGNRTAGVEIRNSKATVKRCVVRDSRKDGLDRAGDGLVAGEKATLHATDTSVERAARAGFIFDNSGGSIHRCLIQRNVFAIDLERGAQPSIGKDNTIIDNKENEVTSRNLKIAPPAKM